MEQIREEKEKLIKKYPYLAFSTNIIEYFAMIGYQENYIKKIMDNNKYKEQINYPTILFSATSNTDFGIIDLKLILTQVYPETPKLIFINKDNKNDEEEDRTSNTVYSFCYDSLDGKKKLFYVCFAYKFYEKYKYYKKNEGNYIEFYVPKAFCIVSQYYYFTFFEYICKNLYILMKNKDIESIPVEITIYNIINFVPSPMNYSLNLDLFSYILTSEKEVVIKQLSGYPYLDFDLVKIFNILPLNFVIEIFILTIIEQSMLFFSSNLEILNMVMFIMFVLNYPCNDTPYFWHIVSVSKENFNSDNTFAGKVIDSLLGVNTTYNDDINTDIFGKYNYIIDIDKKNIILKKELLYFDEEDEKDFKEFKNFRTYLKNILRDKSVNSVFLKSFIEEMKKSLNDIISKESDLKEETVNFFVSSDEIIEKNIKIQEIFYNFYINILTIFMQDNTLNISYDSIQKDNPEDILDKILKLRNFEKTKTKICHDEHYFCSKFRKCYKYKVYFENFIRSYQSIDIFKIPLLFSEEFTYLKVKDIQNELTSKLSFFKIIDALYIPDSSQCIKITLNNIFYNYMDKLKKYFEIFFKKDKLDEMKNQQLITLNKKILTKYIYLLNNIYEDEELAYLFPSITIKETSSIILINKENIINTIKSEIEEKNIIENQDYLLFSLVYIISITLPKHSYLKLLELLNLLSKHLSNLKYFSPHYIYIIIKSIHKFFQIHKEKNIYKDFSIANIKIYIFILINLMRNDLFLPNEDLMEILNLFFTQFIFKERGHASGNNEAIDDKYFIIETNKNFFCFTKYNFSKKKIYFPNELIEFAMKEKKECNVNIGFRNKILKPKINIKINDFKSEAELYTPKKIYKLIQSSFNDFFNNDFDFSKLNIKDVREVIINLIFYSTEMKNNNELLPTNFLIYSLYFLKDL